jgi:hypothetical protein
MTDAVNNKPKKEELVESLDTSHKVTAHDLGEEGLAVNYYQDVEPLMDICARERREDRERTAFQKRPEFRRTMSIPFNILMEISNKYHLNFMEPEDAKKILAIAKRDYPAFKTVNDKRI